MVPTKILNREFDVAKSISLTSLKRLVAPCNLDGLRAAVDHARVNLEVRAVLRRRGEG